MRRAFDGTEIQQKVTYGQQPPQSHQGKANHSGQMNRIRPSSAKPPMYNGYMGGSAGASLNGAVNESVDDSVALGSDNVSQSTHAFYPSGGSAAVNTSQRQFSGGMQRNHSGHRSYENNIQTINRTALQINKINQSMNTSGFEQYGGEIQKHMPRVINLEKEHLYAEALKAKNRVNELAEENVKLKTKLFHQEKELSKQKKIIEMTQGIPKAGGFVAKYEGASHITENLKGVVKDLKTQLATKDDECNKIKKALKYTRIQELETERKCFGEECARLKALLHQALSEKMEILIKEADYQKLEERFIAVSREAEQLRFDNTDMAQQLKDFSTQNAYLNVSGLRASLRDREKDIVDLKSQVGRLKIASIQTPTSSISSVSNKLTRPTSAKTPGTTQSTENGFLKKQIEMKDAKINDLNEEIKALKSQSSNHNVTNNGKINSTTSQQQPQVSGQQQQNQQQLHPIAEDDGQQKSKQQQQQQQQFKETAQEPQDQEAIDLAAQEELLRIGEEVQYKLRAHGMNLEDAAELLFESFEETTSLVDLRGMLLEPPFYLSEESAVVLARYLIEEAKVEQLQNEKQNIPDNLELDWNSVGINEYIFQILTELVGSYNVFSKAYAQKLYDSLLVIFDKHRDNLEQAFGNRANYENSISKDDFLASFQSLSIILEPDQVSFLIMAMILKSPSIDELNYQNLLQLFSQRDENMNNNQSGIYEEDEAREEDQEGDGYDDNEFVKMNSKSQTGKQQQQGVEEDYAEDFNDSQLKKSAHKQQQQQPVTKLQRPQSSKRRAPQANNHENNQNNDYEFDNEQLIDEDDASDEEEVRPPAGKQTGGSKKKDKKKASSKNKVAESKLPKLPAVDDNDYAEEDFEQFD